MLSIPQFGPFDLDETYPDRPAAFAVLERGGKIALVRVDNARGSALHLPGGGVDPGESELQAAMRECGEETGLAVDLDLGPFVRADHYFLHEDEVWRNTRGAFFSGRVLAERPDLKVEDDHTLVWTAPLDAIAHLDREAHAWAVSAWLRSRR